MAYRIERKNKAYYFSFRDNQIVVQENIPGALIKAMKIESCSDYVFCALKTKIKAIGGAAGVEKFLSENLKTADTFSYRAWNLIEHINTYGKELKAV